MSSGVVIVKEFAQKLLAPDGTVVWEGVGHIVNPQMGLCSGAITVGYALGIPNLGVSMQAWGAAATATATKQLAYVTPLTDGTGVIPIGVALTAAVTGENALFAGAGSIINVKSLTAASLASNTIRAWAIPTSTAGTLDATTTKPAVGAAAIAHVFGRVVSIASATVGGGTSGSLTELTVLVKPD